MTTAAWLWVALWLAAPGESLREGFRFRGQQTDYYNLLVDGFQRGELSLAHEVHPDLLSADPQVRDRAPYLLDAALFNGRYYLYYGVVPAALLLWPYAAVTGHDLGLETACLFFVVVGFAVSIAWLWQRRQPEWGGLAGVLGVTILAIAPGTLLLVRRGSFYDLPVAAGYAFMCVFWWALWRFHTHARPSALAIASAAFGLAVGCRANLILVGVALLISMCGQLRLVPGRRLQVAGAAVVPALFVGILLAGYNAARFGSPTDFGFSYGLNSFFETGHSLVSLDFVRANLRWYLLTPSTFAPWFPFIFPISDGNVPVGYSNAEAMAGHLPLLLLAGWCVFGLTLKRRRGPGRAEPRPWLLALAAAVVLELGFVLLLGIRAYRYATDFLTPATFLLVVGVVRGAAYESSRGRRSWLFVASVLTGLAALHVVLASIQLFDLFKHRRPQAFSAWSQRLNPRQCQLEWLGAPPRGGIRLMVTFSRPDKATFVPIVTTGLPHAFDQVVALVHPGGQIEWMIHHSGYAGPRSALVPVEWGRAYDVEVFMGSLFPARGDPFFRDWPADRVEAVKGLASISMDGALVLKRQMVFFESSPWRIAAEVPAAAASVASIQVLDRRLEPPESLLDQEEMSRALQAFRFRVDAGPGARPQPVIQSGVAGKGSLLYLDPLPDGTYRFGIDEWGYGGGTSAAIRIVPGNDERLEVFVGPALLFDPSAAALISAAELEELRDRLVIWLNDEPVAMFKLRQHLESFRRLQIGSNEAGFSSAEIGFAGKIEPEEIGAGRKRELLKRALDSI